MSTKERLKEFIEYKNLSVRSFESSIGVSNSYVSNIFNTIGYSIRDNIQNKYPDLNMDWLLSGRGEMLKEEPGVASKEKPSYISADGLQDRYIVLLEKTNASFEKANESLEQTVAILEAKIAELTKGL